jgi:DNA polymerase elongation subunit (family B)
LSRPTFKNYNREYPVIVKKFNTEIHMHEAFLEDFRCCQYDGIMTFNGRGGVRIVGGERKWFNGYDMPMFYNRCMSLELWKEIQKLSPIPYKIKQNKMIEPSVKVYEQGEKYEIYIKAMPQHDLYFDDMILFYSKNEHEMKKHNLDTFMSHFLGIHKVEHEGEMVWELFERDWELERHYNIVDVEGMYALDTLFRYTTDVAGRALAYGGKIEDGVYASKIHDHINLWYTSDQYVMDTRDNQHKISWKGLLEKKSGGFNLEAIPGAHGYHKPGFGFIIDFSKLYPSCAMTANCDLRTKINLDHMEFDEKGLWLIDSKNRRFLYNDLARSPSGFFRKDILSLNTIIYSDFIRMRKVYSKKMAEFGEIKAHAKSKEEKDYAETMYNIFYAQQFSYKGLTNGKYGADGLEGTRNYDLVIYNTLPSMGQLLIKKVISFLEERNYIPLLASTDSVIVMATADTAKGAFEEASNLCEILNKEILPPYVMDEFNPIKSYVSIDCEKVFNMAIIFDKRRYMLNTVLKEEGGKLIKLEKPDAYYRGMEYVRRDTAMITHDVQDKLMNMIRFRTPKDEIISYLKDIDEKFTKMPWKYICPRAGISNDVNAGSGQKYTACRNANKYFDKEYNAGNNPLLGVFTKHPASIGGKYIEPGKLPMAFEEEEEFPLKKKGFDLDYDHLKEVHLVKKVEPFLQLLFNMKYEQVVTMLDDTFDW